MKKLMFFLITLPHLLLGSIYETAHFEDILKHTHDETLIVCDLDNTLFAATEPLGSVKWGEFVLSYLKEKGFSSKDATVIEHLVWKTLQPHVTVKAIDPKTAEIIRSLQERGIKVLGLTARSPDEAWYTVSQLSSVGINLAHQDGFSAEPLKICLLNEALFENGILFSTTENKKSAVLLKFLEMHEMEDLERVIFVDDKQHHVEDVVTACQKHGIECIGFRFSGADKMPFDLNKALKQLEEI